MNHTWTKKKRVGGKAGMTISVSKYLDFRVRNISRDKQEFLHQEEIIMLKYAPNNKAKTEITEE